MPAKNVRGYGKAFKGKGKAKGRGKTTHGSRVRTVAQSPLLPGVGTRGSAVRAVARKK